LVIDMYRIFPSILEISYLSHEYFRAFCFPMVSEIIMKKCQIFLLIIAKLCSHCIEKKTCRQLTHRLNTKGHAQNCVPIASKKQSIFRLQSWMRWQIFECTSYVFFQKNEYFSFVLKVNRNKVR
jgi:hypothetical protein